MIIWFRVVFIDCFALTPGITIATKKIRIMFMLGAGGLATATSFVRLSLLLRPGSFVDVTFSFAKFNLLG